MDLSIVTTLYQSGRFLPEFHARITAAAEHLTADHEIIYVVDGATDDSLALARERAAADRRVRIVELARNYGHHQAIRAGLQRARGERVFLIDVDLEEPPELLPRFWEELDRGEADVVFGQQQRRKGGWFERLSGAAFYRLSGWFFGIDLPANLLTVRLMRRRYVQALVRYTEREFCFGPVAADAGFRQRALTVEKASREGTTYTLGRKLTLALSLVTSFSDRPLTILAGLGLTILAVSGIALAWALVSKLFLGVQVAGYTSLLVSLWFLGGLTIFAVGVTGLYVGRVYREVKGRPVALVRAEYGPTSGSPRPQTPDPPSAELEVIP
jgi:putative glycosyltransferase